MLSGSPMHTQRPQKKGMPHQRLLDVLLQPKRPELAHIKCQVDLLWAAPLSGDLAKQLP
jgi:hypothetical protein